MLNQRQADLLKLIVEDYIKTARPVSSNSLANIMDVYYYANNEIKFGNIDFMEIKYKAQDRINECLDNLKIFFTEEQINNFNKLIKIY